ncbi:MAG: hypothetical protein R3E82_01795 [Pseudomonadales bacterium]|nr:hypothetical protein [Pseudomonadales bacterium]
MSLGRSIAQTSPGTGVSGRVDESSDQLSGAESALLLGAFFTLAVSLMSFVTL